MRLFWNTPAERLYPTNLHPASKNSAGECSRGLTPLADRGLLSALAPLAVYVGTLALFVIVGIHAWNEFAADDVPEPSAKFAWSEATRSYPAFAVSKISILDKTESYKIFRHPEGGRKDVIQWAAPGQTPVAELELYRLGGEWDASEPASADIVRRMSAQEKQKENQKGDLNSHRDGSPELESAGIIDTKFGPVKLLGPVPSSDHASSCLGFIKRFDDPNLLLSGWTCQGETLPAKRAAVSCLLDRVVLLTAGNDPKLAELFARAELKRSTCSGSATPPLSADWLTGTDNPRLRGLL